ncbi:Hypothetical protein FKW44_004806 [Caligus rogercresseyi]|uniref:Uncharacterized protein n=1 Tax=Caligus rogercresseyi TaxID=217165 RepID=A0A7T8HMN4_CALRO|nr:Hypothetical protein FKW44_004806 [Caligus rogercresseyi]
MERLDLTPTSSSGTNLAKRQRDHIDLILTFPHFFLASPLQKEGKKTSIVIFFSRTFSGRPREIRTKKKVTK